MDRTRPRKKSQERVPEREVPDTQKRTPDKRYGFRRKHCKRLKELLRVIAWPLLTVVIIWAVWAALVRGGVVARIILPLPSEVIVAFWRLMQQTFFWSNIRITVVETLLGFAIGCGAGWLLGSAMSLSSLVSRATYPLVVAFQNTPRIALAPVFLTWFGFGITARVVMSAVICFFPVVISVIVGMQTVDTDMKMLMHSYGANQWVMYRKVVLPWSLPVVFSGVKTAMTLALLGAIVGEFVGGTGGVGTLIKTFNFQLDVAEGFASIAALMIVGLLLYGLVELVDRRVVYWRGK